MRIAPLKMNDPWLGRALADKNVYAQGLRGVPIEATVEVELVELLHGSAEENYRPYLHLRGELTEAQPTVALPYGVTDLALRRGSGVRVDAFYDFSQRQLVDLVSKGYFSKAFEVPEAMAGIPWPLPGHADFVILAPQSMADAPVTFMGLHQATGLELDEQSSGYDLSEYFPDFTPEAQAQAEREAQAEEGLERSGSGNDLFHDVELDTSRPAERPRDVELDGENGRVPLPQNAFERLLQEIENRRDELTPADVAAVEAPEALTEDEAELSPEALYERFVAPEVAEGVAAISRPVAEDAAEPSEATAPTSEPEAAIDVAEAVAAGEKDLFADESPEASDDELAPPPLIGAPEKPAPFRTAAQRRRDQEHLRQELIADEAEAAENDEPELG